jgi:phage gp29-like protein
MNLKRLFTLRDSKRPAPDTTVIALNPFLDRFSSYPSQGLTPERLTQIARDADSGQIQDQAELFEEMLEKDAHLFGIFQSRKLGVAKVEYEIVPATSASEDKLIAERVAKIIGASQGWRNSIEDMLDAVPKGFSALWIEWQIVPDAAATVSFSRLHYVHQKNFRFGRGSDLTSDPQELRRLTRDQVVDGATLEENKWIVPVIKARSGHPARASILRTCTWSYLFKNFGLKAFVIFCEIFGVPLRLGKYEPTASPDDKQALWDALRGLGVDAAAMISKSTEIEFPESQKGSTTALYDVLIALCNREMSKAVLGHTGSSESTPGKLGEEETAKEVRFDLVESDALAIDYVISEELVKPLVDFNFGPREVYPYYKTKISQPKNLLAIARVDQRLVSMGWHMPEDYVTEVYGRPIAKEGDRVLEPRQQQILPFESEVAKALLGKKLDFLR